VLTEERRGDDSGGGKNPTTNAGYQLQDSLIAFIRAAQLELVWIHDREDIEVTRNWSDINQLDLPMLQNYFRQVSTRQHNPTNIPKQR